MSDQEQQQEQQEPQDTTVTDTGQQDQGEQTPEVPTPPAEPAEADTGTNAPEAKEPDTQDDDPRIKKANAEAAKYRTKLRATEESVNDLQAKYDQLLEGLGRLSGHTPDEGEKVDPDEAIAAATKRAEQAEAEARTLRVSGDLRDKASDAGLNARILIPLLKGEGKLDDLDPQADDYATQVEAVVTHAKDAYPELRAQVVPRSSGNAPTPTDNGPSTLDKDDLLRMQQAGEFEEINKAFAEGRFKLNN